MDETSKCAQCVSRRKFIESSLKSVGGAALLSTAGGIFLNCGKKLSSTEDPSTTSSSSPSPSATSTPSTVTTDGSNKFTLNLNSYTNLSSLNGSYLLTVNATSGTKTVFVTRISLSGASTDIVTVSAICTHTGCTVGAYNGTKYICPCHNSQFDSNGAVLQGPASTVLTKYTTALASDIATVTVP